MSVLDVFCVCLLGGPWVWMGVGHPCPPICDDIVTPRHTFLRLSLLITWPLLLHHCQCAIATAPLPLCHCQPRIDLRIPASAWSRRCYTPNVIPGLYLFVWLRLSCVDVDLASITFIDNSHRFNKYSLAPLPLLYSLHGWCNRGITGGPLYSMTPSNCVSGGNSILMSYWLLL